MDAPAQLEALLFYRGTSTKRSFVKKTLDIDDETLNRAVDELKGRLQGGVVLVSTDTTLELATAPEAHTLIEALRKEELSRELTRAALETLAVILYEGPVRKADIDYVRGVNTSAIVRNLMVRGLIESYTKESQTFYQSTTELLKHLGVTEVHELPNHAETQQKLSALRDQTAAMEPAPTSA